LKQTNAEDFPSTENQSRTASNLRGHKQKRGSNTEDGIVRQKKKVKVGPIDQ